MATSSRAFAVACLAALPTAAQFGGIVAPGNGQDVYFSTALPLKGSGEPAQGRIFKIGQSSLTKVAAVTNAGFPRTCLGFCTTNAYNLSQPDLSRDGRVLVYRGQVECTGDSIICGFHLDPYVTSVQGIPGQQGTLTYGGSGRLSGNGRYLVLSSQPKLYNLSDIKIVDLEAGQQVAATLINDANARFTPDGRVVADDGTFVLVANSQVYVYRRGKLVIAPAVSGYPANAVIDSAGETVIYQVCCSPSELRVFNPDTGEDNALMPGSGFFSAPVLSADGQKVAFLWITKPGTTGPSTLFQAYAMNVDGSALRALTNDRDGIAQLTLSDDGQTAWFVSNTGALYEVNTVTDGIRQPIPPIGAAQNPGRIVPGSAVFIFGKGFGNDPRVAFDGIAAPTVGLEDWGLWVQAPWELPSSASVTLTIDNGSPFEMLTQGNIVETRPQLPSLAAGPFHQDWSGNVSLQSPAHPGEVIHFYITGLGPVQPSVKTGDAGPSEPPALVTGPLECNLPLLFAGLAPGLVGFYQVSVQMPATVIGPVQISCAGITHTVSARP
ncbi:MAG: hypothetical protein ACR2NN_11695 [Bryobacteraceae bacterium]